MIKRLLVAFILFAVGNAVLVLGVFMASRVYPMDDILANTLGIGGCVTWTASMVAVILIITDLRPSRV